MRKWQDAFAEARTRRASAPPDCDGGDEGSDDDGGGGDDLRAVCLVRAIVVCVGGVVVDVDDGDGCW